MKVKLLWVNRNTQPTTIYIYRNNVPTPNNQLSNPIANIPGDKTEYVDTSVVTGQTYYYVIATILGATFVYSAPIKVTVQYSTGPGPNKLQYGDSQLGYFGECTASEMFTRDELITWFGPIGVSSPGLVPLPIWDKWVRNGKVLFVPRTTIISSVSWNDIYTRGAVFGNDTTGPARIVQPPVLQSAKINRGYYTFKVRLLTGVDDRNNPDFISDSSTATRYYSEVADLCYPRAYQFFPVEQRGRRHLNATSYTTEMVPSGIVSCTAEINTAGNAALVIMPASPATLAQYVSIVHVLRGTNAQWKPVLELDPTNLIIKETVL